MKRLVTTPKLLLCLMIVWSVTLYAADPRGIKVVIRDKSGTQVGLYENSYALVIGVSDYTSGWHDLPGVEKDIVAVKEVLEEHNFHVTVVENPDFVKLRQVFDDFINRYGRKLNDRLLFYFAGHGHTLRKGYGGEIGYIVPADAPIPDMDLNGFLAKALDMQMIEVYARRIDSKHVLFLFDSCFSGSVFDIKRSAPKNITDKTSKPVRQFIASGSADEEVPDKSIFRQQLVEALNGAADTIKDGYVTGMELGEFLHAKVVNYSRGSQHPQYGKIRDSLLDKGDFVFQSPKPVILEKPSESSFSIDDLRVEADRIKANKAAWRSKLSEMQRAFDQVKELQAEDITPDLKLTAWERFLEAFTENNPYSQEDDKMRQEASQRVVYWRAEAEISKTQKTVTPARQSNKKITRDNAAVVIEMAKGGRIVMNFYPKDAPNTVDNFIKLANKGFYDGLKFHRVIPGFVAQGGDPSGDGTGGPGYQIKAEFNSQKHLTGTLAMARSEHPDSAGSQFYICLAPQPGLDGQYTVFGQVVEGMDLVNKIVKGDVMKKVTIVDKATVMKE